MVANSISFAKLKDEYERLYATMKIDDKKYPMIAYVANKIISHKKRYERIGIVPFYIVGILHYRESNFNFSTHLHNGDPLTWWTINVPKGRPLEGKPPFRWEDSAYDAISLKKKFIPKTSSIAGWLYFFEAYNGFGYRLYHDINSPYLWSATNHYVAGKYTSDGRFSPIAIDKQIGCAAILWYGINYNLWNINEGDDL